jgi:predicted O-methyltransferase YrrM
LVLAANIKKLGRGHVYSLEHDPAYSAKTRELIRSHNLEEWSTVIDAPLKPMSINDWAGEWYDFSRLENNLNNTHIDMLVVDGPPHFTAPLARYPALPVFATSMSPGSHVLMDDANRTGEQEIIRRWGSEYASFTLVDGLTAEKGIVVLKKSQIDFKRTA